MKRIKLYFLIIFLWYIVVLLAYYPGIVAYDAETQLYQVISNDYSMLHPIIHTLFFAFFIWIGNSIGDFNVGMFFYALVQMSIMCGIFAYTMCWLEQKKISRGGKIGYMCYLIFFPIHSILAISMTKDVLFSGLFLLFCIKMIDWFEGSKLSDLQKNRWYQIVWSEKSFILVAVLMLLFRNNAIYAFILFVIWVLVRYRKGIYNQKNIRIIMLSILVMFVISNMILVFITGARRGSIRETLSIPIQQMARVADYEENVLPDTTLQDIQQFFPDQSYKSYDAALSDPVKASVELDNPKKFLEVWAKLGLKYPGVYVEAFLSNVHGYWDLNDSSYAQIYGSGIKSGYGCLSTGNRDLPFGYTIQEHSYFPQLKKIMNYLINGNAYLQIPLIKWFFVPALYVWLLVGYIIMLIVRSGSLKKQEMVPMESMAVFLLCYLITLLLGPAVLVRYAYPLYLCVPILWIGRIKRMS